jgi:hypothetical protein
MSYEMSVDTDDIQMHYIQAHKSVNFNRPENNRTDSDGSLAGVSGSGSREDRDAHALKKPESEAVSYASWVRTQAPRPNTVRLHSGRS